MPPADRLEEHNGLVAVAAAERYAVPERWGLGLALPIVGRTIVAPPQLVVADDLWQRQPGTLAALQRWGSALRIRTPLGLRSIEVVKRGAFLDPDTGTFTVRTYPGAGWCFTADEGRTLGLLADHAAPAADPFWRGGFTLGLAGSGEVVERPKGREWRPRLHRPALRVKPIGPHALMARFGKPGRGGFTPDGKPAGRWELGLPFGGRLVDLIGPAHGFDGLDTGDLHEHLAAFGLSPLDVPAAVTVDPTGAEELLTVVLAIHALAVALDQEAGLWLTSRHDQRDGRAYLGIANVMSPGTIPTATLRRSGVTPPLTKFPVPDDPALDRWQQVRRGGLCSADVRGIILPTNDVDIRMAYSAAWAVTDGWGLVRAAEVREVISAGRLLPLCRRVASGDLAPLFDRAIYPKLVALAGTLPDGEDGWPVETTGTDGEDPRVVVGRLWSSTPIPFAAPDVVHVALRSGRVARVVSETGLEAVGVETERPFPLYDGVVVPPGGDPVVAVARRREQAKDDHDDRLAAQLRVVANALSWGVYARLDQHHVRGGRGRRSRLVERATEWSWPPIAAIVPAVVRMWLGMLDWLVTDAGGVIIARDTDGAAIFASPKGGEKLQLPDGRMVRALAHREVDAILARFDTLDPFSDGRPFWSVAR
jgi:hypothetical protein